MTMNEVLVIAGGAGLGYLVVSMFLGRGRRPAAGDAPGREATPDDARAEPVPDAGPPWHRVLEVAPDAPMEEVRAAYRRLMSQYHPDKVAALGAELRSLAERKSKQIAQAYREAEAASDQRP